MSAQSLTPAEGLLRFRERQAAPVFCLGCGARTKDRRTICPACCPSPASPELAPGATAYERKLARQRRQRAERGDEVRAYHRALAEKKRTRPRRSRYLTAMERALLCATWQQATAAGRPITKRGLAAEFGVHPSTVADVLRHIAPTRGRRRAMQADQERAA